MDALGIQWCRYDMELHLASNISGIKKLEFWELIKNQYLFIVESSVNNKLSKLLKPTIKN